MPDQEEPEETENSNPIVMIPGEDTELNSIALIGNLTEEVSNQVIFSLLLLKERQTADYLTTILSLDEEEADKINLEEYKPNMDFYISTNGGSADEMFGVYDIMRMIRNEGICTISTCGIGKVMSAGTLLLAAGTKGKRRIGKNCRIMVHSVIGGHIGPMHQLQNEFDEIKKIQDNYIKALAQETNMTEKYLRDLLKKKSNVYLDAEEAVKLGFADEVF
jgi:ATP-dependent Clp protease protease subunit